MKPLEHEVSMALGLLTITSIDGGARINVETKNVLVPFEHFSLSARSRELRIIFGVVGVD